MSIIFVYLRGLTPFSRPPDPIFSPPHFLAHFLADPIFSPFREQRTPQITILLAQVIPANS